MQLFLTNYHVLVFRWTFQQNVAKSGSIREKARKIIHLAKTLQLFEQTTMSLHFDQRFRNKLKEVPHFVKKHEKSSIWPKLATFAPNYHVLAFSWTFQKEVAKNASFREKAGEIIDLANTMQLLEQTTMFLHFDELLRKRLEKVVHFVKKHEKSWIWSKLATFGTKYHVFTSRWTFLQTVAKTSSFREKPRQLIDLAKTMQLFRTNYHVLVFRWTFQEKVAKSGSIREKARKIIHLAKTLQFFEKTTMSLHFDELFRKNLQKVPHFLKKHEKPSIWPKLAIYRANYDVLAFSWIFQKEVAKSASFRKKSMRNHRFRQTLQLFEKTAMFLRFDELYDKNLQKLPYFVKKHENSSIWPKLCNFFEQTTMFWCFDEVLRKRLEKVAQFVKKHEKSSIWPNLSNFSNKLPCLCISMNFSGKSCKKCLISWKSTKNHRFG